MGSITSPAREEKKTKLRASNWKICLPFLSISRRHPLEPSRMVQKEALCGALADILWRAGGGKSCTLALASKTTYLSASSDYNQDGITEKAYLTVTHFLPFAWSIIVFFCFFGSCKLSPLNNKANWFRHYDGSSTWYHCVSDLMQRHAVYTSTFQHSSRKNREPAWYF